MPLPLTVSCFSKILVPAHLSSPGQRAVKQVCVCVWLDGLGQIAVCTGKSHGTGQPVRVLEHGLSKSHGTGQPVRVLEHGLINWRWKLTDWAWSSWSWELWYWTAPLPSAVQWWMNRRCGQWIIFFCCRQFFHTADADNRRPHRGWGDYVKCGHGGGGILTYVHKLYRSFVTVCSCLTVIPRNGSEIGQSHSILPIMNLMLQSNFDIYMSTCLFTLNTLKDWLNQNRNRSISNMYWLMTIDTGRPVWWRDSVEVWLYEVDVQKGEGRCWAKVDMRSRRWKMPESCGRLFEDGPIGMAFGLYKPVPLIPQYVLL